MLLDVVTVQKTIRYTGSEIKTLNDVLGGVQNKGMCSTKSVLCMTGMSIDT